MTTVVIIAFILGLIIGFVVAYIWVNWAILELFKR